MAGDRFGSHTAQYQKLPPPPFLEVHPMVSVYSMAEEISQNIKAFESRMKSLVEILGSCQKLLEIG